MNSLSRSKVIILLFSILISTVAYAQAKIKICLTGRIVENLKSYGNYDGIIAHSNGGTEIQIYNKDILNQGEILNY